MHSFEQNYGNVQLLLLESLFKDVCDCQLGHHSSSSFWETAGSMTFLSTFGFVLSFFVTAGQNQDLVPLRNDLSWHYAHGVRVVQPNGWNHEKSCSQRVRLVAQEFSATAFHSLPLSCCKSTKLNILDGFTTYRTFFVSGTLRESKHFFRRQELAIAGSVGALQSSNDFWGHLDHYVRKWNVFWHQNIVLVFSYVKQLKLSNYRSFYQITIKLVGMPNVQRNFSFEEKPNQTQ